MGKLAKKNYEEYQSVFTNRTVWDSVLCQSLLHPLPQTEAPSRPGTTPDIFLSVSGT